MKSEKEIINELLTQAALLFSVKDRDGRYLFVNEEYVRLFGKTRDDFLGKTDHELFEQVVASAYRKADIRVIETRQLSMFEELMDVDGKQRTYLSIKYPVFYAGQSIIGVGLVATDITEAKNLDLPLKRHHEVLLQEVKHRQHLEVIHNAIANNSSIVKVNESGVMKNISDRIHTEQEKDRKHTILQSVAKIQTGHMAEQNFHQAFDLLLNEIIRFTGSEYGFIGEILNRDTDNPYLKIHAITDISWDDASREQYEKNIEKGIEFHDLRTLFGHTISTGEVVVSNDPANDPRAGGLPEGHPPIKSYLGMPIFSGDKFVGMMGISNRAAGYDESLIEEITPILNTGANLIEAHRNEARRIRSESALRESEKKFRAVFNSSHDAIVVFAEKGKFIDCNQAGLRLFGYKNQNVFLSKKFTDVTPDIIFGEKRDKRIKKHIKAAIANGYERMEWVFLNTDGESIPCDITLSPLELDEKRYIQAIIRDNTEKHKGLRKQQDLQKQLAQTQKMESIGHLTGGIAHDFNNILGALIGFAELSQNIISESDTKLATYIDQILTAGHRAKSLVEQMLAFSRGEAGQPQQLPPVNSIKEAVKLLRPTIPSSIEISLYTQDEEIPVYIDPTQLQQLIVNLIINSRDALKNEKGRIAITLLAQNGIEHICDSCHESFSGDYVEIAVIDDGCGISKKSLPRIFEPFYTTKKTGKGFGMGLSVVHGIVHANSGHITVDPAAETGAAVKLFFPIGMNEKVFDNKNDNRHGQSQQPADNGKILVVDDERAITAYLSDLLRTHGYDVKTNNSSSDALSTFKTNPDQFDLIISDQTMPEITGSELAKDILSDRPGLPFILCTGYSATIDEKSALEIGIKAFMQKPINSNNLLSAIRALL